MNSPVATSPAEATEQSLTRLVGMALASLKEHIALFDSTSEEMIWCTPGLFESLPFLPEHPGLSDFISNLDGLAQCRVCAGTRDGRAQKINVTLSKGGGRYYEATVTSVNQATLVLKLKDVSVRENSIQRYLEDRERLFSTSRTISVSEMATTLAHEINQPIGTITNLLRGMRIRLGGNESTHPEVIVAIDQAIDQARFAANIVSRIRDYTHSRKPMNQHIDLSDLVCASVSLLDWEIARDDIDLKMELGCHSLMISADTTMLQQVFVNLLRNAIESMRESGRIPSQLTITARQEDEEVEVSTADNGVGLSVEAQSQLFMPFVSSKPTGMGVGLNICRSFVELHQGRLWLSPNEEGGCTSHVLLPLARKEEKA